MRAEGQEFATGAGANIDFVAGNDGMYTVDVTVDDGDGGIAGASTDVVVANGLPVELALPPLGGLVEGDVISFPVPYADGFDPLEIAWTVFLDDVEQFETISDTLDLLVPQDGTWRVEIEAADDDGSVSRSVQFDVANAAPVLTVPADFGVVEGQTFQLSGSFFDPGQQDSHVSSWTVVLFGTQQIVATGTGSTLVLRAGDDAVYEATYEVSDELDTVSATVLVTVANALPVVQIVSPASPALEGSEVTLEAVGTDPGGEVLTYDWIWRRPGGATAFATGPSAAPTSAFTPDEDGTWTVQLEVSDDTGSVQTVFDLSVANVPPLVDLGPDPAPVVEGTPLAFDATAFASDPVDALAFSWTVVSDNGDVVPGGNGALFGFAPQDDGVYQVTLTADDGVDASSDTLRIVVLNGAPLVGLTSPPPLVAPGRPLILEGSVTDVLGDPVTASIDFGDGVIVPLPVGVGGAVSASHAWSSAGSYTVVLRGVDDAGEAQTASVGVEVGLPSPDLNGNGQVGVADADLLRGAFYSAGPFGDLNLDGFVNSADLRILLDALDTVSPGLLAGQTEAGADVEERDAVSATPQTESAPALPTAVIAELVGRIPPARLEATLPRGPAMPAISPRRGAAPPDVLTGPAVIGAGSGTARDAGPAAPDSRPRILLREDVEPDETRRTQLLEELTVELPAADRLAPEVLEPVGPSL